MTYVNLENYTPTEKQQRFNYYVWAVIFRDLSIDRGGFWII